MIVFVNYSPIKLSIFKKIKSSLLVLEKENLEIQLCSYDIVLQR